MKDNAKFNKYDFETWNRLVEYDPASPSCLIRKIDVFTGEYGNVILAKKGDVVGWKMKDGYYRVKHRGKSYSVSRIIWVLHNRLIQQGMFVDHIDGDRSNNSIENLRLVSRRHNNQNRCLHSNNKSGIAGVWLDSHRPWYLYWVASWYDTSGKQCYKWFSILKYGNDLAKELAIEYRKTMIEQLNASGAGYSERHGK